MVKATPRPSSLGGLDNGHPHSLAELAGRIRQWLTLFLSQAHREGWAMAIDFAPRPIAWGVSMMAKLILTSGSQEGFDNGQTHSRAQLMGWWVLGGWVPCSWGELLTFVERSYELGSWEGVGDCRTPFQAEFLKMFQHLPSNRIGSQGSLTRSSQRWRSSILGIAHEKLFLIPIPFFVFLSLIKIPSFRGKMPRHTNLFMSLKDNFSLCFPWSLF